MFAFASEPGALDLFWFPMSIFVLGIILTLTRNPEKIQKLGLILIIIGAVFITISPFTLPKSPSSAFGQLILFLLGPSILLILAIVMSMNLPNTKTNFNIRTILIILGLSWIILIWIFNPQFNNQDNRFWLKWVISVEIFSAIFLFSFSHFQTKAKAKILFLLLGSLVIILNEESLNFPNASRSQFIEISGSIIGTIIGLLSGILIWFYIIQKLHSFEKELVMDDKLNDNERKILIKKLNDDLNWLETSNGVDTNE